MIARKNTRTSLLLSLYLDDRLDDVQRRYIEERIAHDDTVRREYEELRSVRDLLAGRVPIPANPFLPERIMNRIESGNGAQEPFLPVPRRYVPLASAGIALVLIALVAFAWIQRDQILRYLGDTGTQMQQAYEDTILKGWIMPLFQRTDRDQVLQFAMFGTLPLDGTDGPQLRVDENAERGYQVQLAGNVETRQPTATIDELYSEIRPTAEQQKIFDTLFLYAQRHIESAVLMNEAKQIAIDPSISKYNKVILSGIAENLEPDQLERFEAFLEKRNTPYTFTAQRDARRSSSAVPPPPPATLLERFRTVRAPEEYVVLNDDSFTITRLHLDMDSLRRLMKVVELRMPRLEVRVHDLARNYASSRERGVPLPPDVPQGIRVAPVLVSEGRHAISICIDSGGEIMREMEREFESLRHEVVILRREEARLRDQMPSRGHERFRATVRTGTSGRLTVTVEPDADSIFQVDIDTSVEDGIEQVDGIHIDLKKLLNDAKEGGTLEWRELLPKAERRRIDSLLRESGIEKFLRQEDREELRIETEKHEIESQREERDGNREYQIIPAPDATPPGNPRHIPPVKPTPPAKKDTVIEI